MKAGAEKPICSTYHAFPKQKCCRVAGIRSVVPSGRADGGLIDGEGNLQQWPRLFYIFGWCAYHTRRSLFIETIRTTQIISVPFTVWKLNPNSKDIWINQIQFMVFIWVWLGKINQLLMAPLCSWSSFRNSDTDGEYLIVYIKKNTSVWGSMVSSAKVLVFKGISSSWESPLQSFRFLIFKQNLAM